MFTRNKLYTEEEYQKYLDEKQKQYDKEFEERVNESLKNQAEFMNSHSDIFADFNKKPELPPTALIVGEPLEALIQKKDFKTFKKNGKDYITVCRLYIYKGNDNIYGDVRVGYALRNPKEKFFKKIGERLAYERALGYEAPYKAKISKNVQKEIDAWVNKAYMEYACKEAVGDYILPKKMLDLVKMCMPNIVRNKTFTEYCTETAKESIKYVRN